MFCQSKIFQTEKNEKYIFDFQKKLSASKKPEFQNLVSKMPNWQPCTQPTTA